MGVAISPNDLKNGITVKYKDEMYEVMEFLHVKPGKGGAFVRAKFRNIVTGRVIDVTLKGAEKLEQIITDSRRMEYLYRDGNNLVFMDVNTYEQESIPIELLGKKIEFLKENMEVSFNYADGQLISVSLPFFIELKVIETTPGVKGDTAQGGSKKAKVETGAVVNVPLFIKEGDIIKIDTRTGEYLERVS